MVVEPRVKDYICTTAHPVGCAENVKNQIKYVKAQPKVEGPKKVLVIGSSTGYGLASRIAVAFGYDADTLGVMFEKESNGRRTATAGFYNTRAFEEEAKKIGAVDFLVQGTIYPDVVESGLGGESAVIKSHHNVGGLPDYVDFKEIIEPLRDLFKDEVRKAGLELGIPEYLVFRQPFPGPGLGIRIIGEVNAEKVKIVQDADAIYREEIANAGLDRSIGQYFAA